MRKRSSVLLAVAFGLAVSVCTAPRAFAVAWEIHNHSIMDQIYPDSYKSPPDATLKPVQLVCMRNGVHAATVVIVSGEPIEGLKVVPGDLKGPGVIPAKCVEVRYPRADGPARKRGKKGCFDSLEEDAPEEVKLLSGQGQVIQPLWFKLRVPADAKPGDYVGKIKVTAKGGKSGEVILKAKVFDWVRPPFEKFHGHMDVIQSPESVAMAYNVEPFSDKHFKLLDRSFQILKELGNKTIFITVVRRTHFGNEHAMVRFVRDDKGKLKPDFTAAEKYLEVATKHLGKVPGVIFYCWEPVSSMGHAGGAGGAGRTNDRPIKYTLLDPKTGKLKKRTGPSWGTPECREFWKCFTDGVQPMLKKRGMEKSLLFGLIGDARPTKVAMNDICNAVKDAKWAVHSHYYCNNWQGYDIGMGIALWGIHLNIVNPEKGRGFGWKNPRWLMYYPREFAMTSPLTQQRYKLEMWMGALSLFELKHRGTSRYARGLGRLGGDFWRVLKDSRGHPRATLAGRYPESYWGQLNLNYCISYIMGRGKNGPVPTVRSEAFREGTQDVECRVFVEKATEIAEYKAKVGPELAKRCRELLDNRIRMSNKWGGSRKDQRSGKLSEVKLEWQKWNSELYAIAAEVAKKIDKHYIPQEERGKLAKPKKRR
jgi:hypothetical protein